MSDLLTIEGLRVGYGTRRGGRTVVLPDMNLTLGADETLALVGESGCGKSTLARAIVGLVTPERGRITLDGHDITPPRRRAPDERRAVQMVFQDPRGSLNPRMSAAAIITEGWRTYPNIAPRGDRRRALLALMERVGLDESLADHRPTALSGGQCQRISIARALAVRPRVLVCDEAVSALDVSVQAQILSLLASLRADEDLSMIFISHDLGVVRQIADRVAVMYLGRVVESGAGEDVFGAPSHPYTQALLSAALDVDAAPTHAIDLPGSVPTAADAVTGCAFHTRCWKARPLCGDDEPKLAARTGATLSACHYAEARADLTATLGEQE
jgi:peptide/nickel transport system ATP-binding protein/oligopeptide transport system ATP-binding protein